MAVVCEAVGWWAGSSRCEEARRLLARFCEGLADDSPEPPAEVDESVAAAWREAARRLRALEAKQGHPLALEQQPVKLLASTMGQPGDGYLDGISVGDVRSCLAVDRSDEELGAATDGLVSLLRALGARGAFPVTFD